MLDEIKDKFNDLTESNANQRNDSDSSRRYGSSQYGNSSNYGSSNYGSSGTNQQGSDFGKYSRSGSSHGYSSTPRYKSSSEYSSPASSFDYGSSSSGGSGKVWIAALAGASAGLIAGMLMAPETGKDARQNLMRSMGNWGDELDRTVKSVFGKLEDLNLTGTGSSLAMKGNWNEVKGNLKQQYSHLTDDDLNYVEGNEDEFVGNLQRKLGKTKREVYDLLGMKDKNM